MAESQSVGSALRLEGVGYRYPGSSAGVDDVSLNAAPGEIYALLGQNGAGKTTLMRLMVGLLRPRAGRVLLDGRPLLEDRRRAMTAIGSLIETPSLYLHLSGRSHLDVFAAYYGVPAAAAGQALERVGLAGAADTPVKHYSLGMKQRLGLATALLHDPALLVLDEPGNGLDPGGIAELRALLTGLAAEGKTVIVSSHLLAEVERSADRIAIVDEGRLRFEGSPAELTARGRRRAATLLRTGDPAAAASVLEKEGWACRAEGDTLLVEAGPGEIGAMIRSLAAVGQDVLEARSLTPSLEEDFLSVVREAPSAR